MMARFYGYLDKVFQFRDLTARLTDSRLEAVIPTAAVFGTAFALFATCRGSLNGIDQERRFPGRLQNFVGPRVPSGDTVGRASSWYWATTFSRRQLSAREFWRAGHWRWDIENDCFNSTSTHWGLNHVFRHEPTAIVNFVLTLFLAFVLLQCFWRRNLKPPLRDCFTLKGWDRFRPLRSSASASNATFSCGPLSPSTARRHGKATSAVRRPIADARRKWSAK